MRELNTENMNPAPSSESKRKPPFYTTQPEKDYRFSDFLAMLWRRKAIIAWTIVVVVTLSWVAIHMVTPRYTATAQVMLKPQRAQVVEVSSVVSGASNETENIQNEAVQSEALAIRSRNLADRVISTLHLSDNPDFNDRLRPPSRLTAIIREVKAQIGGWLSWLTVSDGRSGLGSQQVVDTERERLIDKLLDSLSVTVRGRSWVIEIAAQAKDPRLAADIANAIAEAYIRDKIDRQYEATRRTSAWLSQWLRELQTDLQHSEQQIEEFRRSSGLLERQDVSMISREIAGLNQQLLEAQAARIELQVRIQRIESQSGNSANAAAIGEVLQSPLIQQLRQQEAELARQYNDLAQRVGRNHPAIRNIQAELSSIRSNISVEIAKIVERLHDEMEVATARERAFSERISHLTGEVEAINTAEMRLRELQRDYDANRTLFERLLARSREAVTERGVLEPNATIVSQAGVPDAPSFPRTPLLIAASTIFAFALGVLLAFWREFSDPGFRSAEQVEQLIGVPALGLVPLVEGRGSLARQVENIATSQPASAFGEAIRRLYAKVVSTNLGAPSRIWLIASSVPEEGKSTIAVSLGRMLALSGKRTLVVDCDLRFPTIHKKFAAPRGPGLADYILGEAVLDDVVRKDEPSGASFIAAGTAVSNPLAILESPRLKAALLMLADMYDFVIVDSAPVAAVVDTLILSRCIDKTIFVVRWAKTRRELVIDGISQLSDAGADVVGVLLSQVNIREHAQYRYRDSGVYHGNVEKYFSKEADAQAKRAGSLPRSAVIIGAIVILAGLAIAGAAAFAGPPALPPGAGVDAGYGTGEPSAASGVPVPGPSLAEAPPVAQQSSPERSRSNPCCRRYPWPPASLADRTNEPW